MSVKICDEDTAAEEKLPPEFTDNSGIGAHYVDAYVKPMNVTLEDGRKVSCKRRGLKLTLTVGDKTGTGLMRRLEVSPDPKVMLQAALAEAAKAAEVKLVVADGAIQLDE
jgi:hypothetical protein